MPVAVYSGGLCIMVMALEDGSDFRNRGVL